MAKPSNHYDVAFERLLRLVRRPYVSVNETRRALFRDSSLKSMDFVVYSQRKNLLVDVKGRRFEPGRRVWDNWTTQDDITGLMHWESVFGAGFRAALIFAYEIASTEGLEQHSLVWDFNGRRYAFYGVYARDYAEVMKVRSASWQTVWLSARDYQHLRRPILELL